MKVAIFLVISLVGILQSMIADAAKGKSAVAIPRKSKGNPISRSVFGSMFSRAFREMKVTFCSELEALTLQVRPFCMPIYCILFGAAFKFLKPTICYKREIDAVWFNRTPRISCEPCLVYFIDCEPFL